ncbi:MAG: hypothetical protein FJ406_12475 [Verrucomicrobia bacterium]|nr:hypothetical protein [Verrucomicrobiota bacterium]MBM3871273.1 hypothetical protein [Verrucomicrobiota bacterium]
MRNSLIVSVALSALVFAGCVSSREQLLKTDKGQVELRRMQSRAFDTTDSEKTLRTIMATLQDLGFVIDKSDSVLGSVTATKLKGYNLVMTVSIRPKGEKQLIVRASAQYGLNAVSDPQPYQDFFTSLSKAMFLEAQQVD